MALAQAQVERFRYAEAQKPDETPKDVFEQRLLKKAAEYYALTKHSRARRYPLWMQAAFYSVGIHHFLYNPVFAQPTEIEQGKVDRAMLTPSCLLQHAIETIAAQYGSSNGRIVPAPINSDDPKVKAVVRSLREYVDYLDWSLYQSNPAERQIECKLIPLRGVYTKVEIDYTKGQKITLPQYEAVEKQICQDCGSEVDNAGSMGGRVSDGSGDGVLSQEASSREESRIQSTGQGAINGRDQQGIVSIHGRAIQQGDDSGSAATTACPACGSANIQRLATGINNKGDVSRRTGEPVKRLFDPYQVEIYDRNRGIPESPYLICDDILFKTEAKKLYLHLKTITGQASLGSYKDGYLGLHFLQQLQCAVGNSGGLNQLKDNPAFGRDLGTVNVGYQGSFLNELLCWRRRVWFDKSVYADWPIGQDKPVQLPGRDEFIPPETKCGEIYPDGLCFHIINGETVVLTENEDKNAVWSFCGYRMPSAGLHGTGVSSLVSMVKGYDAASSFELQALLMAALGIMLVDERVPNPRNSPGSMMRIPQSARLQNETVASMAARLDLGGAAAIAAAQPVKEAFRSRISDMTLAPTPDGGDLRPSGLGKGTATAVRYQAGATGVLVNPPLELYANHRAQVIQQAVKLMQSQFIRPQPFGKFGDTVCKWFDASEIPEDVRFGVAEDSWRMRTLETERDDLMGAAQIISTVPENEPLVTKALKAFNLDDDISDASEWEIVAEKQLDAMKALAPQYEAMAQEAAMRVQELMAQAGDDPMAQETVGQLQAQMQAAVPLRLIEAAGAMPLPMDAAGHPFVIKFLENVRLSDGWDGFSPLLQDAIRRLWALHQQGVGTAGAITTEQQVMASEPARQAQKQDAAEQAEQQAGLEAPSDDSEQQEAMADNAHARQMQVGDVAHTQDMDAEAMKQGHAKEMENLKHKHALEIEKARAKNKPKGQS